MFFVVHQYNSPYLDGMETPNFDDIMRQIKQQIGEAYQRGWQDAVAAIATAAQNVDFAMPSTPIADILVEPADNEGSMSIIDVIYNLIKEQPGQRGVDIFRKAVTRVPGSNFVVMDRSGRTALSRLRVRGQIFQRSKKWYPKRE